MNSKQLCQFWVLDMRGRIFFQGVSLFLQNEAIFFQSGRCLLSKMEKASTKLGYFSRMTKRSVTFFQEKRREKRHRRNGFPGFRRGSFGKFRSVCQFILCVFMRRHQQEALHISLWKNLLSADESLILQKLHVKPAFAENEKSPFVAAENLKH